MNTKKIYLCTFLFYFIFALHSYAGVATLINRTGAELEFVLVQGEELIPVENVNDRSRSKPFIYKQELPVQIRAVYMNKSIQKSIDVPKSSHILIVAYINTDQELNYFALNDSEDSFPKGSYQFINLTHRYTVGLLGENELKLKPFENEIVKIAKENFAHFNTQIAYMDEDTSEWVVSFKTRWLHRKNARIVCFIIPKKGDNKKFSVFGVAQYPQSIKDLMNYAGND